MAYVNVPGAMWYCLGGVVEGVRAWFVTYAHMAMVALVMAICSFVRLHFALLLLTTTLDSVRVVCVICRCALGICRRTTCFATCSCTGRALQEAWITCCALFLESPGDCSGVVAYVNVPGAMWYCLGGFVEGVRAWFVTYAHMAMVALVMAICSYCVFTCCLPRTDVTLSSVVEQGVANDAWFVTYAHMAMVALCHGHLQLLLGLHVASTSVDNNKRLGTEFTYASSGVCVICRCGFGHAHMAIAMAICSYCQDNVFCHLQLHGERIARGMDHLLCTLSGKHNDR